MSKNTKAIVALIETNSGVFLMMTDPRFEKKSKKSEIQGFESIQEGVAFFERAYNAAHQGSYESSMSACINNIFFRPSIVEFNNVEEIVPFLAEPVQLMTLTCVAGRLYGLKFKDAKNLWEKGTKPELIHVERPQPELFSAAELANASRQGVTEKGS